MDLDRFTATELDNLHNQIYTRAVRLYGRCDDLLNEARAIPAAWDVPYQRVMDAYRAAHAAAKEQYELLTEVGCEIRNRRAAVHA